MNKLACILGYAFAGIALFGAGWFVGHQSSRTGDSNSSELLEIQMFNAAYKEIAFAEALGIQLVADRPRNHACFAPLNPGDE